MENKKQSRYSTINQHYIFYAYDPDILPYTIWSLQASGLDASPLPRFLLNRWVCLVLPHILIVIACDFVSPLKHFVCMMVTAWLPCSCFQINSSCQIAFCLEPLHVYGIFLHIPYSRVIASCRTLCVWFIHRHAACWYHAIA